MIKHATLRQLKVFEAVARNLSVTRAAEELHTTQPTVSIQLKQLTELVGLPLIEQIGKKISLTETGHLVYAACRDVLDRLSRLMADIDETQGLARGTLKLSIITTAKYFVPRLLGNFYKLHPGIEVSLEVANRDEILDRLAKNMDDLYIMGLAPEQLEVMAIPFMENPLVVVAAADHPLATESNINPDRLGGEPFIVRERGSGTRLAAENFFRKHGVQLNVRMQLGSNEAVKQAVAGGLGIAVLSQHTLALDQSSGAFAVLDVQGFPLLRQWYAVYPAGKHISAVTRAFLDYIGKQGGATSSLSNPGIRSNATVTR
jgi:DNA-binding transcriptional LysR family regulator